MNKLPFPTGGNKITFRISYLISPLKQCALALCIGIIKQAFIGLVRLVGWKKSNKAAGSSAAFPYIFVKAGMVLFYFLSSKVNQEKEYDLIGEKKSWAKFKTRITSIFHFTFGAFYKTHQQLGREGSKPYADGFVKNCQHGRSRCQRLD